MSVLEREKAAYWTFHFNWNGSNLGIPLQLEWIKFGQKRLTPSVYKEDKHVTLIDHNM